MTEEQVTFMIRTADKTKKAEVTLPRSATVPSTERSMSQSGSNFSPKTGFPKTKLAITTNLNFYPSS